MRLLGFLFLVLGSLAEADFVSSNGISFYVDGVNSRYQTIFNARASVFVSGSSATIEVRAQGYQTGREYLSLYGNQTSYNVRVRLQDPPMFGSIKDTDGKAISSYVNTNQFSEFDTNRFAVECRISEAGFTQFQARDVQVRINYMMPFMEQIRVDTIGNTRIVRISLRREDIREFSNQIQISVPRDPQLAKSRKEQVQKFNFFLQNEDADLSPEKRSAIEAKIEALSE